MNSAQAGEDEKRKGDRQAGMEVGRDRAGKQVGKQGQGRQANRQGRAGKGGRQQAGQNNMHGHTQKRKLRGPKHDP